jgi:hypothetical protein
MDEYFKRLHQTEDQVHPRDLMRELKRQFDNQLKTLYDQTSATLKALEHITQLEELIVRQPNFDGTYIPRRFMGMKGREDEQQGKDPRICL